MDWFYDLNLGIFLVIWLLFIVIFFLVEMCKYIFKKLKWKKCFFCVSVNGYVCLCMVLCFISFYGLEIVENV